MLILSSSAGAGHVRAAQALEQAFAETGAAHAVQHDDALDYVLPPVRRVYGPGYLELVTHAPAVLGWLYDALDRPGRHARLRAALDGVTARPLVRLLETTAADWIVCTHFLPAAVASALKARGRLWARLAVVVTDFDAHGLWLVPHVDRYFVVLEETRRHLAQFGVPPARITVSGIPIDPVFADPAERARDDAQARARPGAVADPGHGRRLRGGPGRAPRRGAAGSAAARSGGGDLRPAGGAQAAARRLGGGAFLDCLRYQWELSGQCSECLPKRRGTLMRRGAADGDRLSSGPKT